MADFFRELPKAELHLHLEGSVDRETMRELAPDLPAEELQLMYQCSDFRGFLGCFKLVAERLRTPEDYGLVLRRLLSRLGAENVRYVEIILAAGVVLWKGLEFGPIYQALRAAQNDSSIEVYWILDAIRHFGCDHAMQVAELAAERVNDGVLAFGIGGDEARGPARWCGDVYTFARSRGLRLTAHAGETMGPDSIWAALEIGAERIGHGIRAVEDPVLMRYLRDHDIPVEISITSNVITGVVRSAREHPMRQIFDAGVPVVLNTDDPGIFCTTLSREYELAARELGFSEAELCGIAENGFRYGFGGGVAASVLRAKDIARASEKVRAESMRVNADFAAIERDPDV